MHNKCYLGWLLVIGLQVAMGLQTAMAQTLSIKDQEALQLGRKIQAVMEAIKDSGTENAMMTVTELGTDSRYYVMVRGWLTMQLQGDLSIIAASGSNVPEKIKARARFLEQAIRIIDLE